jgi:hypothetical protein
MALADPGSAVRNCAARFRGNAPVSGEVRVLVGRQASFEGG